MGKRILKNCKYDEVVKIVIVAVVLCIVDSNLCSIFSDLKSNLSNKTLNSVIHLLSISTGVFFAFTCLRSIAYSIKTGGRSYSYDHRKYKRYYDELVEYFHDADPHVLDLNKFKTESWKNSHGIMLGVADRKLIKLESDAEANIFGVGTPGSGKTTGLVIPTCARYKGSVLAVDIKGDIYNFCKEDRKIMRFCPDLKDKNGNSIALQHSSHFNPFGELSKMDDTEKKLYLGNMALTLIPNDGGSDGNYFSSRARKLFLGIVHYLLSRKPDITFPEILHAVLHKQKPENIDIERLPATVFEWIIDITSSDCLAAIEQVSSLYGNNEKNICGAFDCLITSLTPFSNDILDSLLDGKGECISAGALEKGFDVYLQISQENLDLYAPLFTMIMQSFMSAFTKRPDSSTGIKNRPILIVLDEFPQFTFSYKMINSTLSTQRSKSVQCMLLAQSIAQMSNKYQNDGWRALIGNCTYQLIFKSNEEMTQKHFSTLFGSRKILKISNSDVISKESTTSRVVQETREPIFQPEDFGNLDHELCIYYNGKRIKAKKIVCYR